MLAPLLLPGSDSFTRLPVPAGYPSISPNVGIPDASGRIAVHVPAATVQLPPAAQPAPPCHVVPAFVAFV